MESYTLKINGRDHNVQASGNALLLWVIREQLGLTGTKYGCGISQCGACTIHLDGMPARACSLTVESVSKGQEIVTIEGLSENGDHPVQRSWIKEQVPQCGYCQSGQIMQAVALLRQNPSPTRDEIKAYMNGNLCRCGTYMRIVQAIEDASESVKNS